MPMFPLDLQIIAMRSYEIAGTMGHYKVAEEHQIREANAKNSTETVEMENRVIPTPEEAQEESKIQNNYERNTNQNREGKRFRKEYETRSQSENESLSYHLSESIDPELGNIIDVVE